MVKKFTEKEVQEYTKKLEKIKEQPDLSAGDVAFLKFLYEKSFTKKFGEIISITKERNEFGKKSLFFRFEKNPEGVFIAIKKFLE